MALVRVWQGKKWQGESSALDNWAALRVVLTMQCSALHHTLAMTFSNVTSTAPTCVVCSLNASDCGANKDHPAVSDASHLREGTNRQMATQW